MTVPGTYGRRCDVTIARQTDIFLEVSPVDRPLRPVRWPTADGTRPKEPNMMSDRPSDNLGGLDIDLARRIDEVCRRFEADGAREPVAHR